MASEPHVGGASQPPRAKTTSHLCITLDQRGACSGHWQVLINPCDLCITCSSIDVASIFKQFWNGFGYYLWWCCDTFSVRARNLLNLQKPVFSLWTQVLTHQKKTLFLIIFMVCFVICVGSDCGWLLASMLFPFWYHFGIKVNVVLQSLCYDNWDGMFVELYQKQFPFRARWRSLFGYCFASWPLLFPRVRFRTSLG